MRRVREARPSSVFTNGANVIAVEIQQSSGTSSDISFDRLLHANRLYTPPTLVAQPHSVHGLTGTNLAFCV